MNYTDSSRSNRSIPVKIYYPAEASGDNQPFAGEDGTRYPVFVFGHGFTISIGNYQYLGEYLAARGFIVAMVDTEGGFLPNHTNFGKDLAFVTDRLQVDGATPSSPLFGRVGEKTAVGGHSMGGGASYLAPQYSANITALVTFAAANTNPSSIDAAATITLPSMVIAASNDKVAPPSSNQGPIFTALASSCKLLVTETNGSHCNYAPDSFTCSFGEGTVCIGCSFMDGDLQREIALEAAANWLAYTLQDCADGLTALEDYLLAQSGEGNVTYTEDCTP